ncbi:hypothetical protein TRFO_29606 [Tritrichomonas foetus]|uniref:Uncharacterized protein n=1 Tax=Tritrichomonas foetus TaxID=1144522 RepID=A0A1J4JZU3_9EUKA|nr:hypothetical protein TRFO_29606 [Tritrichomonas foetus]|eukprot:OHT03052.1 hypothetical protein TRFO_29606 [Tritrichomonas foetus]
MKDEATFDNTDKSYVKQNIIDFSKHLSAQELNLFILNYGINIFELATKQPNCAESTCAFQMLDQCNSACIHSLAKNIKCYEWITNILSNDNPPYIVSRCASIVQKIIQNETEFQQQIFDIFIKFLPFIENTGVFDLLSYVILPFNETTLFCKCLSNCNFINSLLREIQNEENHKIKDSFQEKNENDNMVLFVENEKLSLFLLLLRHCAKNEILKRELENEKTIQILSYISDHFTGLYVQNHLWQTVSAICSINTSSYLFPLFEKGIKIVSEPYLVLHIYHTCIIDFIGKFITTSPNIFDKRFIQVLNVMSRLITQFPDCSNLQASISRFICASLECEVLQDRIINYILPLVIMTAQNGAKCAATANCAYVLHQISVLKFTHRKINVFCKKSDFYLECCQSFLNKYEDLLRKPYGGELKDEEKTKKSFFASFKSIFVNDFHPELFID